MKFSELSQDTMLCVEIKKSLGLEFQILTKQETITLLATSYLYPSSYHAPLPKIYIAINTNQNDFFECGECVEIDYTNIKGE